MALPDKKLEELLKHIGMTLYEQRTARKESLESVASMMNMPPDLLDRIEKGQHNELDVNDVIELSSYYDIDPDDVVP